MPKSLREQLRAAAPNLNPTPAPKKERPEAEVLPDMRDVIEPQDRDEIVQLVTLHAEVNKELAELRKGVKPITAEIKKLLTDYEDVRFMVGNVRVVNFCATRKKLNPTKLMALGVTPAQIAAATDVVSTWTLKITPPGAEDDEE